MVLSGTVLVLVLVGYGIVSTASARTVGPEQRRSGAGALSREGAAAGQEELGGRELVPWESLTTYSYEPGLANLPAPLRALDGKTVTIRGYLTALYEQVDIHE